jgi:RNA polymerase sigma factor (sigma-70 family)
VAGISQRDSFPLTRHSVVVAAQSSDPAERTRAMAAIAAAYWRPVYKYVRLRWKLDAEDASDLTQDLFARMLEKEFLDSYDPAKGRLRTFLRICIDRLVLNQSRDQRRLKRGSGAAHVSLDFNEAERELGATKPSESPEDYFEKEWVRSLFAAAVERLHAELHSQDKMMQFRLFERYDLAESAAPSYAELADEFGITSTTVTNYLASARREFRRCVLDQLREMTGSDEEFRREAESLLGVRPK